LPSQGGHRPKESPEFSLHLAHAREGGREAELPSIPSENPRHKGVEENLGGFSADASTTEIENSFVGIVRPGRHPAFPQDSDLATQRQQIAPEKIPRTLGDRAEPVPEKDVPLLGGGGGPDELIFQASLSTKVERCLPTVEKSVRAGL
jgi:hypothetical protein